MRPSLSRIVRPTARCLEDDLGGEVEPKNLDTAAIGSGPVSLLPIPLFDVEHLLLDKANHLATNESAEREPIASVDSHALVKVKTSDRRGALWSDENGQWWLLAAGRRKDGDADDFYSGLERLGGNAASIMPTAMDRSYLALETAYIEVCEEDREAQRDLLDALVQAATSPSERFEADVHGATVSVRVVDDDDDPSTLELSFEFYSYDEQDRFPTDVMGYIPGHECLDDWDIVPTLKQGDSMIWYTLVSADWLGWLAASGRLDEIHKHPSNTTLPDASNNTRFSHHVPKKALKAGLIDGLEITALCGARFTPHRDPEAFATCSLCKEIYEAVL